MDYSYETRSSLGHILHSHRRSFLSLVATRSTIQYSSLVLVLVLVLVPRTSGSGEERARIASQYGRQPSIVA